MKNPDDDKNADSSVANASDDGDWGDQSSKVAELRPGTDPLNEREKLEFAKHILFVVAILFAVAMILRAGSVDAVAGQDILEASTTILPAIATLVIGYYFGQK